MQTAIPSEQIFLDALNRLQAEHVAAIIRIGFPELIAVISTLQLGMRHPDFPDGTRRLVMRFIGDIQKMFAEVEPTLNTLIEMGFDPDYDVVRR